MIRGGNATIFVSDMNRAVQFYVEVLGLKLEYRAGDHWAQVDAGEGMKLGLHPESETASAPGTRGAIQIGLNVTEPLDRVVEVIRSRGGKFEGDIRDDKTVRIAFVNDPDGNELYLCELKS